MLKADRLLNDTVATLLAGKSASIGHEYETFIGYILGTGPIPAIMKITLTS